MGTNSKFVSENKLFFKVIIREIGKNNTHSSMTYSGNQQKKRKEKMPNLCKQFPNICTR